MESTSESAAGTLEKKPAIEYTFSNWLMTLVVSWLLPGAGHWLLGHRARGVLHCVVILALFWIGQWLAGYRAVNRDIHPIFFVGQVGNGFSTLFSEYFLRTRERGFQRGRRKPIARDLPRHLSTGINFTTISGLLNILLVLHIADPRTWGADARRRREGEDGGGEEGG